MIFTDSSVVQSIWGKPTSLNEPSTYEEREDLLCTVLAASRVNDEVSQNNMLKSVLLTD